eukprot:Blabericola_migrator_1__12819@NODE_827_length_6365_cov_67_528739_g584_i0_p2_GENE_NODE_827_length_6365_cov_67_528739_g584_i0NODE_827_length_6365_cov_67_528739_g584_i0_p2_ORF_typecomplete_len306_score31_20_NODE_827_length_6365_cov_67_528739_g584_i039084825
MSGARYLSRVKNAHITAPSKYVALTILSLEPTLAVKGNSSCFLACFGYGDNMRRQRVRFSAKFPEGLDATDLEADWGYVSIRATCDRFQYFTQKLDTVSQLPPHLSPLLDHCKKIFLKSCGLYLLDEERKADATGQHEAVSSDPCFSKIVPEQTVAMLKEFSPLYRGKEFDDEDMVTFEYYITKYAEKCYEDLKLQADAAKGLLILAERDNADDFLKCAEKVDASFRSRYNTTYRDVWEEIQKRRARADLGQDPLVPHHPSDGSEDLSVTVVDSYKVKSSSPKSLSEEYQFRPLGFQPRSQTEMA